MFNWIALELHLLECQTGDLRCWCDHSPQLTCHFQRIVCRQSSAVYWVPRSAQPTSCPGTVNHPQKTWRVAWKINPLDPETHTFLCGSVLDLTFQFPPPPLRKCPASWSLQSGPQYWIGQGRVSEGMMLMMGELQARAHTALRDGHTWKQGNFAHLFNLCFYWTPV